MSVLHRALVASVLQSNTKIPNTLSPQGKNHGATRWNWSSGLQTWTLPRVPIYFPGIWDSQRTYPTCNMWVSQCSPGSLFLQHRIIQTAKPLTFATPSSASCRVSYC